MAVTDDFNRANGGLGANWVTGSSFSALAIVSNTCKGAVGSQHCVGYYTAGGTIAADQYAQFKVITPGGFIGPALRSDGVSTFYTCFYNAGTATIYKWISASATQIGSGSTITPAANDVVYLEVVGTALTMKVNGTTVCTATDSSITAAGYTGIDLYDNVAAVDDFEGGVVGAVTVTVNLTGVAASPAVGVLGFNGSLPLVGVAATPVIGTGTVQFTGDVSVSLVGVAASPRIGTGTVAIEFEVITPPVSPGGGTGAGKPARSGMRLRPTEDKAVYLKGVTADPKVGQVMVLHEMQRAYEKYSAPMRRAEARKPAEMPPGMRRLFKKPIPPAVFVHPSGFPKLKANVGTVTVKAFYEDSDEELTSMLKMMDVDEDLITALKLSK